MEENTNDNNKNKRPGYKVFAALMILVAISLIFSVATQKDVQDKASDAAKDKPFNLNIFKGEDEGLDMPKLPAKDYIARVYITGIIEQKNHTYNQKWLMQLLRKLKDDPHNRGILLCINSPGGTVYEADEVYLLLEDYKMAGKKVWTYMEALAASGGYYISCAAEKMLSNRNTLTGSIGVICGSSVDMTELFSKVGIKVKTFHAGRNKIMGSVSEPLTQEQDEIMQKIADECYEQFTAIVSHARNIPVEEVRSLADGRIYTAQQARMLNLIDDISLTLEDATSLMMKEEYSTTLETVDCKYEYKPSLYESLLDAKTSIEDMQLLLSTGHVKKATSPLFLYVE